MSSNIGTNPGYLARHRVERAKHNRSSLAGLLSKRAFPERVLLCTVVLMSFGLWLLYGSRDFIGAGSQTGSGSAVANILWFSVYLIGFVGIIVERRQAFQIIRASLPLVLYLLIICASATWSEQPALSARRSIEVLGTSALGLFFVCRLELRTFVRTLAVTIGISAILSVLLITLIPSIGFQEDAFAGFFSHKNGLGPAMVLGLGTIVCLGTDYRKRFLRILAMIMFLTLLAGSKNAAGAVTLILMAALYPALIHSRNKHSAKLLLLMGIGFVTITVFGMALGFDLDDVLQLFGRDSTFTGRTQVWQDILSAIGDRPFLGYGISAFWGIDGPAARLVYSDVHWAPASAHNGFIEVALGLGLFGEAVLMIFLTIALWRAFHFFWQGQDALTAWPLLTIIYVILSNFSGATLDTVGNTIDFLVLVAAFLFSTKNVALNGSKRTVRTLRPVHSLQARSAETSS